MRMLLLAIGLILPTVASANPLTGSILVDSGVQWWLAVNAAITLIEWLIFALSAKYNWVLALPIALLANLASGLVGAVAGPFALFTTVPGFFVELLVVYGLVRWLQRFRVRAPISVFIPVVLMNVATFWIAPALWGKLPVPSGDPSLCASHMSRVGKAIEQYALKHKGQMPRVNSVQELKTVLGDSVEEKLYHCPSRSGLQLVAPLTPETEYMLLLPWPDKWMDGNPASYSGRVIIADPRPTYSLHSWVRTCLFADGHAQTMVERNFQPFLDARDHTRRW